MARLELPNWAKPDLWLNDDNAIVFHYWKDQAEPYGGLWLHRSPKTGECCTGGFAWRVPDVSAFPNDQATWSLVSFEPLTLSPSLLCLDCGAHGFIENGGWRAV